MFFGVGEVALITAALVVLQTHVLFERDGDGRSTSRLRRSRRGIAY